MNNWIVIRSFTNQKRCWFVRVAKLQLVASSLDLELSTCECNGVPDIIQDSLNAIVPDDQLFWELD